MAAPPTQAPPPAFLAACHPPQRTSEVGPANIAITINPTFRGTVKLEAEMVKLHQFWFGRYLYRPAQFVFVSVVVH